MIKQFRRVHSTFDRIALNLNKISMVEQINEDECRVTVDGVTGDAVVVKATLDDFQMGMTVETTGPGFYISGADTAMKAEMERKVRAAVDRKRELHAEVTRPDHASSRCDPDRDFDGGVSREIEAHDTKDPASERCYGGCFAICPSEHGHPCPSYERKPRESMEEYIKRIERA